MEWIDIKKQKPEIGYDYLVTNGDACMVAAYRSSCKFDFWSNEDFWADEDVTHWMPLPPKPKKEKLWNG